MSRRFSFLLPLVLLSAAGPAGADDDATAGRPADHVVLISVDGLRPEFYLDPGWPAPRMQQLMREGSHAEAVESVYPTVTYPSHTSMVTGVRPARHGVYYNSPFEPGGETGRWYWEASAIRVPTLWDVARDAGLQTAALGWPVTVGAPIDRNLPEVWSLERGADPIEVVRAACQPPDLLAEIEREATGRLRPNNFTIDHLTRDDRAGAAAAYLLETYRPNLLAVHLIGTDHFQHEDGREAPRVRLAVAAADRAISQIVEAAERAGVRDRTAFVVTGDHGHVDLHTRLAPNVWLVAAGLREASRDRGDWRATFHTTGAAAFLHLRDPGDQDAVQRVRELLDALPPAVRSRFRVLDRAELDRLGAAPEAALSLALDPGIHVTSSPRPPALRPATGATHGYLPHHPQVRTGLIAAGAGIRRGTVAPLLQLTDVAPLVAHLLGLEMPPGEGLLPAGFVVEAEP